MEEVGGQPNAEGQAQQDILLGRIKTLNHIIGLTADSYSVEHHHLSMEDDSKDFQWKLYFEDNIENQQDPREEEMMEHAAGLNWLPDKDAIKKESEAPHEGSGSLNTPQFAQASAGGWAAEPQHSEIREEKSGGGLGSLSSLPFTMVSSAETLSTLVQSYATSESILPSLLCSVPISTGSVSSSSSLSSSSSPPPTLYLLCTPASKTPDCTCGESPVSTPDLVNSGSLSSNLDDFSLPQKFLGNTSSFLALSQLLGEKFAPLLSSMSETSVRSCAMSSDVSQAVGAGMARDMSQSGGDRMVTSLPQPPVSVISSRSIPVHSQTCSSDIATPMSQTLSSITTPVPQTSLQQKKDSIATSVPLTSVCDSTMSASGVACSVTNTTLVSGGIPTTLVSSTDVLSTTSSSSASGISVGIGSSPQSQTPLKNSTTAPCPPQFVVYNVTPLIVLPQTVFDTIMLSSLLPPSSENSGEENVNEDVTEVPDGELPYVHCSQTENSREEDMEEDATEIPHDKKSFVRCIQIKNGEEEVANKDVTLVPDDELLSVHCSPADSGEEDAEKDVIIVPGDKLPFFQYSQTEDNGDEGVEEDVPSVSDYELPFVQCSQTEGSGKKNVDAGNELQLVQSSQTKDREQKDGDEDVTVTLVPDDELPFVKRNRTENGGKVEDANKNTTVIPADKPPFVHDNQTVDSGKEDVTGNKLPMAQTQDSGEEDSNGGVSAVPLGKLPCVRCTKIFDSFHELQKHIGSYHRKPYVCDVCGVSLTTVRSLQKHKKFHTDNQLESDISPKPFASQDNLEKAMPSYSGQKSFVCEVCKKSFYSSSALSKHKKQHSSSSQIESEKHRETLAISTNNSVEESVCDNKLKNPRSLRNHLCEDLKLDSHTCQFCEKKFPSIVSLRLHLLCSHKDSPECISLLKKLASEHKSSPPESVKETTPSGSEDFVCLVCSKVFNCLSRLQIHERVHKKIYRCKTCGQSFSQCSRLKDHQHRHTGIKNFTCKICQICNQGFVTRSSLYVHRLVHSGQKRYTCDICGESFSYVTVLKYHRMLHSEERPFKCDLCDKAYVCASYLKKHKIRVHSDPKFACDLCDKSCYFAYELKNHRALHMEDKPKALSCDICSKSFRSISGLKKHTENHLLKKNSSEETYTCDLCEKVFNNMVSVRRHKRRFHSEKSFTCEECNKVFKERCLLKEHMNVHLQLEVFMCEKCGKDFYSNTALRSHKRLKHVDPERQYVCEVCGKSFPYQSYLRDHKKVHSKEKTLICKLCNKAVKYKLYRHMQRVHNIKPKK